MPDMVLLQLSHSIKVLRDFRVNDACPSWFFHGYVHLTPTTTTTTTTTTSRTSPDVLYIYKRLKPRIHFFHRHPDHGTLPLPDGCLWERVPVSSSSPPVMPTVKRDDGNDDGNDDQEEPHHHRPDESTTTTTPTPTKDTYRIVNPPYLNLEQEYGSTIAHRLFSKETLEIFQREALAIPQWTPWPETQHYSVGPKGETTWTVFPLCYCFPAHDVSQRTWVSHTRSYCPQTCHLLESILGETLRTALFSQLLPETTLEAHTGWADLANAVLRLHIPLIVPSTNDDDDDDDEQDPQQPQQKKNNDGLCGTWVDGCVETHQVGRPILFDDSKIHRAFNYSSPRLLSSSSEGGSGGSGGGSGVLLHLGIVVAAYFLLSQK
jgi:hypothetical protein